MSIKFLNLGWLVLAAMATSLFAEEAGSYNQKLELQGTTFSVSTTNSRSQNKLTIAADGLKQKATPIINGIEGIVTGADLADLNNDGSPEVYVYVTSAGSGSYGSLVAPAGNNKQNLSDIYLPDITEDKKLGAGYLGHDEFSVVESVLGRRFPVYRPSDTSNKPTGGIRQIAYKLVPGEAGWFCA